MRERNKKEKKKGWEQISSCHTDFFKQKDNFPWKKNDRQRSKIFQKSNNSLACFKYNFCYKKVFYFWANTDLAIRKISCLTDWIWNKFCAGSALLLENKTYHLCCLLWFFYWLVGCLTSQQHASVSQGLICWDNYTCCHTEIQVADQTFHLTQSQYTDTASASPSTDLTTPSVWHGSHWSAKFEVTGMNWLGKILAKAGFELWIFRSWGGRLNH